MHVGPPPKPKYRYVAPTIMLLFAAISIWVAIDQLRIYTSNPSRTDVACSAGAVESVGARKWIALQDCSADLDEATEILSGTRVEGIYIPLRDESGALAGFLYTKDDDTIDAAADFRTATTDADIDDAAQRLMDRLSGTSLRGLTATVSPSDIDLLERHIPGVSRDTVVLEHLKAPDRGIVIIGFVAAGILLPLGIVFGLRARKLSAADAAERLAWHQAQAAQQAAYAQPQYGGYPPQGHGPPPQGYGPPPQGYGPPPQGYGRPPGSHPPQ